MSDKRILDEEDQRILDEGRALEPTCAVASSPAARSFKARLRKMATADQVHHLALYCEVDYVALVRCGLAIGISANFEGAYGTPLYFVAAANGSARSLKALLDAGADVRLEARKNGVSALHSASAFGHTECVRLLLKAKALVDATNNGGMTPLMAAACAGHRDIVELLLSAGASLRARDADGNDPLHHAARGDDQPAVIQLLLKAGADANATNALKNTPLVEAIAQQHYLAVCALLPVTDLSIVNRQGRKALHVCVADGNDEILDLLLPSVTDLDAGTVAGIGPDGSPQTIANITALQLGCGMGQHTMVKKLLRLGASRTALDSVNETALSYATSGGYLSCAAILLGRSGAFRMTPAEVNLASSDPAFSGWTALHYGARSGQSRVCGLLMQAGARLDAADADGNTPLMVAQHEHPTDNALFLKLLSGNWAGPLPGTTCEHCFAVPESALMHCSGCLSVRYCCPRCATADWPQHAAYCKEQREAIA